jgi:hypothetical protein
VQLCLPMDRSSVVAVYGIGCRADRVASTPIWITETIKAHAVAALLAVFQLEAGVADQILHEMVECSVMRRSRRSCRCTKKGQLRYSMSYIESYPCHCRCKLECSHHRAVMCLQSKIWSNRRIRSAEIVPGFNGCIGVNFSLKDFLANVLYYSIASLMYWSK